MNSDQRIEDKLNSLQQSENISLLHLIVTEQEKWFFHIKKQSKQNSIFCGINF